MANGHKKKKKIAEKAQLSASVFERFFDLVSLGRPRGPYHTRPVYVLYDIVNRGESGQARLLPLAYTYV